MVERSQKTTANSDKQDIWRAGGSTVTIYTCVIPHTALEQNITSRFTQGTHTRVLPDTGHGCHGSQPVADTLVDSVSFEAEGLASTATAAAAAAL